VYDLYAVGGNMSNEDIRKQLEADRTAMLEHQETVKSSADVLSKAEKYAKGELNSLIELFKKVGIKPNREQALAIQEHVLQSKIEWLQSQATPVSVKDDVLDGWDLAL